MSLCSSRWGSEEASGLGLGPSEASFIHMHDSHMEAGLLRETSTCGLSM